METGGKTAPETSNAGWPWPFVVSRPLRWAVQKVLGGRFGRCIRHWAAKNNHEELCTRFLVEALSLKGPNAPPSRLTARLALIKAQRADPNAKDAGGLTPADYARRP